MKAVIFERFGNPCEVLEIRDIPIPKPARGQVRVRMIASPINPSDLLYIAGGHGLPTHLPATPGFEGVGVVVESGGGFMGWLRKGQRVAVINDRTGNWQEHCIIPARQAIPVSSAISDEQAACFFVNPATVVVLARHVLRVPRGAWLLQSAAGSSLGRMMIRLARRDGFRTINVVRRPEQVAELKQLGADEVICESTESIADRVGQITKGQGVSCAMDPVGGATGSKIISCLGDGGKAIVYGVLTGEPITLNPRFLIGGSKRVEGFLLSDWARQQSIFTLLRLFRQVGKLIREGVLQSNIGKIYPLDQIREAVRHAERAGKEGKILLKM
jgi:NADPH:quinone reductase-like Zn-dependent oxidoreductase